MNGGVFDKKLVDLQSRYDQWIYFLQHLESMEVIPELFMTDTKFKKAFTIAEIAKMKPEDALQYNLNRMEYIEIKGVADASFADGKETTEALLLPQLEQERKGKAGLLASLKRLLEAGVSKELVAAANQITVPELEKMLGL